MSTVSILSVFGKEQPTSKWTITHLVRDDKFAVASDKTVFSTKNIDNALANKWATIDPDTKELRISDAGRKWTNDQGLTMISSKNSAWKPFTKEELT